jgi:hypothetical protein
VIALLAVLVLLLGACGQDGDDDAGRSGGSDETSSQADEPVTLSLPESSDARCMMVGPEVLAQMDTAFEGTVTAIEGDQVTLEVDRWFTGGDTGTVVVTQQDTAISVPVVEFEEGGTYLVSATDGVVSMCGFSAESSPDLAAVYEEAFGSSDR